MIDTENTRLRSITRTPTINVIHTTPQVTTVGVVMTPFPAGTSGMLVNIILTCMTSLVKMSLIPRDLEVRGPSLSWSDNGVILT